MAIPAKRFQCLTGETDSAVATLTESATDIYNSVNNELKMLGQNASDFIEQATANIPDPKSLLEEAKNNLADLIPPLPDDIPVRETKELIGKVRNLTNDAKVLAGSATRAIEGKIKGLLPDVPGVSGAFDKLSQNCKNNVGGFGGLGKPFDKSLSCGGRSKKATGGACNSGQFSNVLNSLTNGDYNAGFRDLNSALGSLYALSKFGYNMNMCGVFGALAGTDLMGAKEITSRAAAGLMGDLSSSKLMNGVMDLSGSVAALGLHPWLEKPGLAGMTFSSTKIPIDATENDFPDLADRIKGSAEIMDPSWTGDSVADLLGDDEATPNLGEILDASMMDNVPSMSDLDSPLDMDSLDLTFNAVSGMDMSYAEDFSDLADAFI